MALALALMTVAIDAIDGAGLIDHRFEMLRIPAALLGGGLAALSTSKLLNFTGLPKGWQNVCAAAVAVLVVAVPVTLGLTRSDQEYMEGKVTADHPWDRRTLLSGGNGYRYYITLERHPSDLSVGLEIRGQGHAHRRCRAA